MLCYVSLVYVERDWPWLRPFTVLNIIYGKEYDKRSFSCLEHTARQGLLYDAREFQTVSHITSTALAGT